MSRARTVAIGLLLVVGMAGCGSGTSSPQVATAATTSAGSGASTAATASVTAAAAADDHGVAWAKCMRAHGVDVADPSTSGKGVRLLMPKGQDHSKADAAMKQCQKLLPGGGKLLKPDPAAVAQMRKMSKCMRENGVPKFPDPSADGGIKLNPSSDIDPNSEAFTKAQQKCAQYAPDGAQPGHGTLSKG